MAEARLYSDRLTHREKEVGVRRSVADVYHGSSHPHHTASMATKMELLYGLYTVARSFAKALLDAAGGEPTRPTAW